MVCVELLQQGQGGGFQAFLATMRRIAHPDGACGPFSLGYVWGKGGKRKRMEAGFGWQLQAMVKGKSATVMSLDARVFESGRGVVENARRIPREWHEG